MRESQKLQVTCGGRWQGVAVPSGVRALSAAFVGVAFMGDGAGVVPRPVGGRKGRPQNRRLCVGGMPGGPLSRGDLSVLGEGDMGVTGGEASTSGGMKAAPLLA